MKRVICKICFCLFFFGALTSANQGQTITGIVHNETKGKPSVGDDVVLIRLGEGMEQEARTKADADGAFKLDLTSPNAPHFVRVMHQGVNYDQTVTAASPLQIVVYDVVSRIPGLSGSMGIVQMEADAKALKITEMYVITNTSNPPVTQSRADNYQIAVPPEAAFDSVEVRSGKGMWVNVSPSPIKGRERAYALNFPIRPGETLFHFVYHVPYTGRATLRLHLPYPIARFGVMHPRSIAFKALQPNTFTSPGPAGGLDVESAVQSPLVGDVPAFEISGVGTAPQHGTEAASTPQPAPATTNPAAGHSVSTAEVDDKSKRELWLLIGGIVLMLAVFAFAVWRMRRRSTPLSDGNSRGHQDSVEALKEELFQLESDRVHGSISADDYATTKDALNRSIQRALSRKK
ncbi:MAG TPA: hypothetical protein VJA94_10960 [Candidatus Angelobacter sp.]